LLRISGRILTEVRGGGVAIRIHPNPINRSYWQPHAPPQHPPPDDPEEEDPPDAFVPFPCAANTESCIVLFALAHFGQVTFVLPFSTMRSYSAPQSSQTYS
jgi:hypothetical protein